MSLRNTSLLFHPISSLSCLSFSLHLLKQYFLMGRKKLPIKKQKNIVQRYITFAKRRKGLYSKAKALCMDFNAQIAIIMSSPAANPNIYSFGYPSTDTVIDAFITGSLPFFDDDTKQSTISKQQENEELERELNLENEKLEKKMSSDWWEDVDFEGYNSVEELEAYMDALKELKDRVNNRLNNMNSCSRYDGYSFAFNDNNNQVINHGHEDTDFGLLGFVPNMESSMLMQPMAKESDNNDVIVFSDSEFDDFDNNNQVTNHGHEETDFGLLGLFPNMGSSMLMQPMAKESDNNDVSVISDNALIGKESHGDSNICGGPEYTDETARPVCVLDSVSTSACVTQSSCASPWIDMDVSTMDELDEELLALLGPWN